MLQFSFFILEDQPIGIGKPFIIKLERLKQESSETTFGAEGSYSNINQSESLQSGDDVYPTEYCEVFINDSIDTDIQQSNHSISINDIGEIVNVKASGPGRKFKIPFDVQLKAYKEKISDLLDEKKKIRPASHTVYEELRKKFNYALTVKAIQLSVVNHADLIFGKNNYTKKYVEYVESEDQNSNEDVKIINIKINEELLPHFHIVEVKGPNRNYKMLKPGWSDVLFDIVRNALESDCIFSFKRCNVIADEFIANGTCTECGAELNVVSEKNREELKIDFTAGSKPHLYTKRRRLTKARIDKILPHIKNDTVHNYHSKQVNEFPNDLEHLPRDYVSEKALSNIKRHLKEEKTSINALRSMKYLPEYKDCIKEIGTDPFYIIFWTQCQKFVYSQISKKGRLILSIDATGGLVSNYGLMKDLEIDSKITLPHIFLYLICVKNQGEKSVPIAQMLSAQQDTKRINYFFERFLDDFQCPHEVVVDDSGALLKACAKTFANCRNTNDYISKCYSVLDSSTNELPECFIRLDVSHFVKNLHKTKVFDKIGYQAKHFYLSILAAILQTSSFESIKIIVKDMLLLANYPIEGVLESGDETPATQSRVNLQRFVRTHNVASIVRCNLEENEIEYNNSDEDVECSRIQWYDDVLNEILVKVKDIDASPSNLSSNTCLNNYCCPSINNYVRELMQRLPLWSCVMKDFFKSELTTGVSADTESRFSLIKNNVFHNYKLPIDIDKFVKVLIDESNAVAKLSSILMKSSIEKQFDEQVI